MAVGDTDGAVLGLAVGDTVGPAVGLFDGAEEGF